MDGRLHARVAVLALAVCLTTMVGVGAAEDEPLLLRLNRPDVEGYEDARAVWEALTASERVALLREGLASPEPALAEVAAAEIGGQYLSLDEIHRRQVLLQDRFGAAVGSRQHVWGVGGTPPVGAPDVVPLWTALAGRTEVPRKGTLELLHRVTLPEHLPELVPLLAKGDEHYFESLFWTVCLVANYDASDRFRVSVERGLEFGLRRLQLERRRNHEALRAHLFDPEQPAWVGEGLPPGFVAIARATWGLDPDGFRKAEDAGGDVLQGLPPYRWLHRQAARFTPIEKDGPFLTEVVRSWSVPLDERWWAMRHLLRLSPDWGGDVIRALVGRDTKVDVVVAAALAEAGRPDLWHALDEDDEQGERRRYSPLAWAVDPEWARAAWLDYALGKIEEGYPVLAGGEALDLGPLERARYRYDWGVVIRDEDLRWIAARLAEAEVPALFEAEFLARVLPEALTPGRASDLAARMGSMTVSDEEDDWLMWAETEATLGALEVANRDALCEVLSTWVSKLEGYDRQQVLVWLAKLGDTSRVPEMLQSWPEWDIDGAALGHVRDDRVAAFLKERLLQAEGEEAGSAFAALCIFHGVPSLIFDCFLVNASDVEDDPAWRKAVERLLAGDAVGAILADEPCVARLGLIPDTRVEAYLRRAREDRAGETYWPATAGLALHGDAAARAELLALVREGRMWFFDGLLQSPDAVVLTCDGDTDFLDAWVGLVESNCCIGWAAEEVVFRERFPTMPVASTITGGFTTSAEVRAWLERYRGRMRYSRILGGWLPRAQAD